MRACAIARHRALMQQRLRVTGAIAQLLLTEQLKNPGVWTV
ncbi:hypothetical protein [Chlorogloea sp. CCALA 695]|nr:hypothetical protein [Chlorogloea sp. CCALA 695]